MFSLEAGEMRRIEGYSFGSVRIDGEKHTSDLIVYPDRIESNWWRKKGHTLRVEDIPHVLENPPDVLVVGCGDSARMIVHPDVKKELDKRGIRLFSERTGVACERFNELSLDGAHVVAALHLTC